MAKHLVTMLIGVMVEADDRKSAVSKAMLPFRLGALPSVVAMTCSGARLAKPGDETEIQRRLDEDAVAIND